jgi:hypothetical protein
MKSTTTRLAGAVIDLAGAIRSAAAALPDDSGVAGAEAVLHLRDAQRSLNLAHDAVRLIAAQQGDAARAKP